MEKTQYLHLQCKEGSRELRCSHKHLRVTPQGKPNALTFHCCFHMLLFIHEFKLQVQVVSC